MRPYLRPFVSRISSVRPLRPPSIANLRRSQSIRLQTTTPSRPQLPFLPSSSRIAILRSLSTRTRADIRYQLRIFAYSLLALWVAGTSVTFGKNYLKNEWLERLHPTPPEWTSKMRSYWRSAQHELSLERLAMGIPDWFLVGASVAGVIREGLKDPQVKSSTEWDPSIPGIDRDFLSQNPGSSVFRLNWIGEDLTAKSEDWKQGWFDAWMAYAVAAEKRADVVIDKTRGMSFDKMVVIGPSNPSPPELAPGSLEPPLEENCIPASDSPTFFYTHILTTKGYNARQRIDAALAWAAWLDHQGDSATAAKLYDWSMNLACSALAAEGTNPKTIVDPKTKIIKSTAPFVTSNILKTCTKYAEFEARSNNLSAALSVYTSLLRAYRAAPEAPAHQQYNEQPNFAMETWEGATRFFRSLWSGGPSHTVSPSGNGPFERTQVTKCDEALVMTYIGEILFATGSADAGLAWTRDATALAETGFQDEQMDRPSHLVCSRCLGAVLENWHRMTETVVAEENKRKVIDEQTGETIRVRKGWLESLRAIFGGGDPIVHLVEKGDWHREAEIVDAKRTQFMERRLLSELEAADKGREFVKFNVSDLTT